MKKRIISFLLTIVIIMGIAPMGVYAADYETQLRQKGFPESYIAPLAALHAKYPKWEFEALNTGETWQEAVNAERSPHKKQVVQMTASNDKRNFYCQCADCYKNGSYVIREGKNWVAASENAVAYYMDPRESLDERYIFQFETIDSNKDATQTGVEAILKGTWMQNANITYKDVNGNNVTYSPATKYSQAIMDAAKKSGISAYYLASKIVQEVGGAKPTAGGASGTYSGYEGIYNYYNICANTGARDGLDWASTTSADYKTNCNAILRQKPTTDSSSLGTIDKGTKVTYLGTTATQPDGYKWYQVKATVRSGATYTGYVRSDLIDGGTADKYNRPWTNPYVSIINGAVWIANNFKNQNTGYLQKFNVNPASGSQMHDHEYMANVQGASQEASKTYNAYNAAGLLNTAKKFVIPVYKNLPGESYKVSNIRFTDITENSACISFNKINGVSGYEIQMLNDKGVWEHYVNTGYYNKVWDGFERGKTYTVRIRTYNTTADGIVYSNIWSDTVKFTTLDYSVKNVKASDVTANSVRISFDKVTGVSGYEIQMKNDKGVWEHYVNTGYYNKVWDGFADNKSYTFRVRTYISTPNGLVYDDKWSNEVTFKTDENKVQNVKATEVTANSARISFDKIDGVGGYEIQMLVDGKWEHYVNTGYYTKVWDGFTEGTTYTIRVRTYQKSGSDLIFSNTWSDTVKFTTQSAPVKPEPKVENIKITDITRNSARISFDKIDGVGGYEIQMLVNGNWEHYVNTGYYTKVWDGFTEGTTYTIRVRTYQKNGSDLIFSNTWSDTVKFTTQSTPVKPEPKVENIKITDITRNSARISFDKIDGVGGYEIQMLVNGNWEHYVNTGYYTKVWDGFTEGTTYTIRVRTYQKSGSDLIFSNTWSDTVKFTTQSTPVVPPAKVTNVKTSSTTTESVRITFDRVANANGYQIQVREDGGEWQHYVYTGYYDKTWSGFKHAARYELRVRAYNLVDGKPDNFGEWSDLAAFTTKPLAVTGFEAYYANDDDPTAIVLLWDEQPEADGYIVYGRADGYSNGWEQLGVFYNDPEGIGCMITELLPDVQYEFKVRAFKGGQGNLGADSEIIPYYYYYE